MLYKICCVLSVLALGTIGCGIFAALFWVVFQNNFELPCKIVGISFSVLIIFAFSWSFLDVAGVFDCLKKKLK